jgi:hypothetical protein
MVRIFNGRFKVGEVSLHTDRPDKAEDLSPVLAQRRMHATVRIWAQTGDPYAKE